MTTKLKVQPAPGNRSLFRPLGEGEPLGWYPVLLSSELSASDVVAVDLCDGHLAVYRGEDGTVRAMKPYCAHMGSDLTVGDVVGNDLRCAFHHWRYGPDGICTDIPSGDRIPKSACTTPFAVQERWGLIWVFWGSEPFLPIPEFRDWDDDEWLCRSFRVELTEPMHIPPWVFTTNVFDFVHFRVVHGVAGLDPEVAWGEWSASWTAKFPHPAVGEVELSAQMWGTNSVMSHSVRGGDVLTHIAATAPLGERGTEFFVCVATQQGEGAEEALDQQQALHSQLILEDLPIMNTLRLGDDHLVASDRELVKYLRYVRDFPRATMAELEAR